MPRTKRLIPIDLPMHIMSRSNNKQNIFNNDNDKLRYYSLLLNLKNQNKVDILHYCIMNNHTHLIVMLNNQTKLSRFMKQVNLSYFNYYRIHNNYSGHLWQGRFKSSIIDNDRYLLQCGKYIELNPVRAGVVCFPQDYKFSSYGYYATGANDRLITASPAYLNLSEFPDKRKNIYIEFTVNKDEIYTTKVIPRKRGRPRNK